MSVRDHLQAIYSARGQLTPQLLVDEARDGEHPLHDHFEWDDSVAGEKYRLVQARDLIRSVRVTTAAAGETGQREWVAPRVPDRLNEYMPAVVVAADPFLRELHLRQMEHEWRELKRRWETFEEFWRMVAQDNSAA